MYIFFQALLRNELKTDVFCEHKFLEDRKFRFDFAIISKKIAIEIEGGVYTNGRHVRGNGYIQDMEKYNLAIENGWVVLRYTPEQLNNTSTLDQIIRVYKNRA